MTKITSTDVAREAGVSQTTVSAALYGSEKIKISEDTRRRVIEAARSMGYGPYKRSAQSSMEDVVVLIPTIYNQYYPILVKILENYLFANGLRMVFYCTNMDVQKEIECIDRAANINPKGIIYTFTPSRKDILMRVPSHIPMIIFGESDFDNAINIGLNSQKAGYMIAEHLYQLGHRKLAYISGGINHVSLSRKKRLEGILEYARQSGIDKDLIVLTSENSDMDGEDAMSAYTLTDQLLKSNHGVTAIIGANDNVAIGIMNAIKDNNLKIPTDISVCGFDNTPLAVNFRPAITSVDHCLAERVRLVIDILINGTSARRITYDPNLMIRESTGKCPEAE